MRIALVTETFFPATDGTTRTVKAVADHLIDAGHDVRIIAPAPGLPWYRRSPVVRVRPLDRPGRQVRVALAEFEPDLVHVTSPGSLGAKALKHARRLGLATLVVEQSSLHDVPADHWRRTVAERADTVLVTSAWMVDRVAEVGGHAELWSPGVDTVAFTPRLRDPWLHARWSRAGSGRPLVVVGYVGSLRKRHDVRRLADLADVPGIRPVVIGGGPQLDRLRSRLPGATFTGALGTGDLTVALASLDVLVHPGGRETCCHALREAAASGVPVVAPRSGGATDVVRHLESGLLHDPADPLGMTRAVSALVADRRRALLGERGRELVTSRDWHVAVDELVARHYAPFTPAGETSHVARPAAAATAG
ncbi:MAG: glycosyl transferase, group 1 [Nocardioides sp.]|jgi:phosphatidylinositol alpha 1,6-mannosyltransferase|nr:glycosyl transferase, group 1 [Nocardioides sp.]